MENGGIIIKNKFPISFKVCWKTHQNQVIIFKSRGDLSWPLGTAPPNKVSAESYKIILTRTDSGDRSDYDITPGTTYHLYYAEDDILCDGLPIILMQEEFEAKTKERLGRVLVQKDAKYRVGSWTAKKIYGHSFKENKSVLKSQVWDFVPGATKNKFIIVNKERKCLVVKGTAVEEKDFNPSEEVIDSETWIITAIKGIEGYYTIKSASSNTYLDFGSKPSGDDFINVRVTLTPAENVASAPKWRFVAPSNEELKSATKMDDIEFLAGTESNLENVITFQDAISKNRIVFVELFFWDREVSSKEQQNGLIDAVSKGYLELLGYLVKHGTDADVLSAIDSSTGGTALHIAVRANQLSSVEKLLELDIEFKIKRSKKNHEGKLAIDLTEDETIKNLLRIKRYANDDVYTGEWDEDNKRHGNGKMTYAQQNLNPAPYNANNIGEYAGEWVSDLKDGRGTLTYSDGFEYDGQWKDDKKEGSGKILYPDGTLYVKGEWQNNKLLPPDPKKNTDLDGGGTYKGEWSDHKRHGQGFCTYPDGGVYNGQWKSDKKEGKGKFKYLTVSEGRFPIHRGTYDGHWKDDKKEGQGTFTYSDGGVFEGEWDNDKRKDGQGIYTYRYGGVYNGHWKDNKKEGQGIYTYPDGNVYNGQWKDDKKDGIGKFKYHQQSPFPTSKMVTIGPSSTTTNNKLVVKCNNPNMRPEPSVKKTSYGDIFEAKFDGKDLTVTRIDKNKGWGQNLQWELIPTYNADDHGEYYGQWKDDKKEGVGIYTYPDGGVYDGHWKDDKKTGPGTFTYPDGRVVSWGS